MNKARRILLKISGEALSGEGGFGIDPQVLSNTAKAIRNVQNQGVQTVLVIGGGDGGTVREILADVSLWGEDLTRFADQVENEVK